MRLNGQVAIITGAAQGIGKSIATLFAQEGAQVVVADLQLEKATTTANEIIQSGGQAIAIEVDITNNSMVQNLFEITLQNFGKIDIVINNAGFMDNFDPIGDISDAQWDKIIDINLNGTMKMCRTAVQYFLKHSVPGAIVNYTSAAGLYGSRAGVAYTAAKHAIVGMTKNIAFMYADQNIRCNAIAPSSIKTEMATSFSTPNELGLQKVMSGVNNNPKMGEPIDAAKITLFLASSDSNFVSGAIVPADAGWFAY